MARSANAATVTDGTETRVFDSASDGNARSFSVRCDSASAAPLEVRVEPNMGAYTESGAADPTTGYISIPAGSTERFAFGVAGAGGRVRSQLWVRGGGGTATYSYWVDID